MTQRVAVEDFEEAKVQSQNQDKQRNLINQNFCQFHAASMHQVTSIVILLHQSDEQDILVS